MRSQTSRQEVPAQEVYKKVMPTELEYHNSVGVENQLPYPEAVAIRGHM